MQVVFLEDVPDVAKAGEIKNVKDGYGRNFLLPRKLAAAVTPIVLKQLEEQRKSVTLVVLPDERVKLSEKSLKEMERDIVEADDVENNAKARFVEIFSDCCPALAPDQ